MTLALYRKWRPQTWDEVVGQEHVIETLRNAVRGERVAHAYLFAGPRGTGKTTTARLLAKAVNCLAESPADRPCNKCPRCLAVNEGRFLDLVEIDAASNTSVEDVRELRERINFSPNEGRYKVYIVDEVHMLSTAAFNALLKTLEEPPDHAIFVLATTEVHKIPATVLSRCQRHEFRRLPVSTIVSLLEEKSREEGLGVEPEALTLIARQATGSLRDAISLLDQLASTGETVGLARAREVLGAAASEAVREVLQALAEQDARRGLTAIGRALDGGADPRQFARQVVNGLRDLLLVRMGNAELVDAPQDALEDFARLAERVPPARLLAAIDAFNEAALDARGGWLPSLPLEVAMVQAVEELTAEAEVPTGREPRPAPPEVEKTPPPPVPSSDAPPPEPRRALHESGPVEAAPDAEEGQATAPPLKGALTFQVVMERWDQVLAAAYRRDPRTQALLNSCRPLGLQGDVLMLGFASDLLREKMEKEANMQAAQEAMAAALGKPLRLRCVLKGTAPGKEPPPVPVEDGGMVDTALRDLGGQVVEVKPASPDAEAGAAGG